MQQIAKATTGAGFTVEKIQGEHLHVQLNGQTNRLSLTTAYNAYKNAPDRLDDIVQAHLKVLGYTANVVVPTAEPGGSETLLPLLQQKSWLDEMKTKVNSQPVHQPFITGLIVTYVIDAPAFRTYLNEEMLEKIISDGVATREQVHESALQNLRSHVEQEMEIDTHNNFSETIITSETREGYASSCILLPELMEAWHKKIPGNMLIGIPNRDFIIAFSDKHPAGIAGIERQTQVDARTRDRPLSSRLLIWKDGQAKEFRPLN